MLENIGGSEILLVLLVTFLFFGPRALPELGRSLGRGVHQCRRILGSARAGWETPAPPQRGEGDNRTVAGVQESAPDRTTDTHRGSRKKP
ncbi:MAG: twin-arginine translocase TatA/TatE family subunit [Bacteroidota bacterium]